jgi:AcrR family transcriptional regulator
VTAVTDPSSSEQNRETVQEASCDSPVRQRIISGARHRFYAYGFRGVTMDDLAGTLGMSKKTLYAYFPSKLALLEAVVLDKFREVEADLTRITSECATDFRAGVQRLFLAIQRHLEEIQPPFVRDVRREAPDLFNLVETRRRELIHRQFSGLFEEGCRAGVFRSDIPPSLVLEILLAAVHAIVNPERMDELGLTPKLGFSVILTVILEGILTDAGRTTP